MSHGIVFFMRHLAILLLSGPALASAQFTSLTVFGDSLSDTGNVSLATGGALPGAGYATGRYSNGDLWVDGLATRLGLPLAPSGAGGRNFAWGSAETGPGATSSVTGVPTLVAQIAQFQAGGGTLGAGSLATVWAGGNDIFNGLAPNDAADRVVGSLSTLQTLGASRILVVNLVDLGQLPRFRGGAQELAMSGASDAFNARLALGVAGLASSRIALVDVASFFDAALSNPAAFGFTNTTDKGQPLGAGGANYVWWDESHPTTKAHGLVADLAYTAAVPEPASLAAIGLGLAAVRRRRARA